MSNPGDRALHDESAPEQPASLHDLVSGSLNHTPAALAQEFTEVTAVLTEAAHVALYIRNDANVRCYGLSPAHLESPLMAEQPADRFPWGMPSLQPRRFVLVEDASELPLGRGVHAADLGIRSAAHLPMGPHALGAMHIYWDRQVNAWDDELGAQLRAFGGFVVGRIVDGRPGHISYGRRRSDP